MPGGGTRGRRGRLCDAYRHPVGDRIRRIDDERVCGVDPGEDLDLGAEIPPLGDRLQAHAMLAVEGRHLEAAGAKQDRVDRDSERARAAGRESEMLLPGSYALAGFTASATRTKHELV